MPGDGRGDADERGFQFPCRLPIKAIGRSSELLREQVLGTIRKHAQIDENLVRARASGDGNFQSITVTVDLQSRRQMEDIYRELAACEDVLWTL